MKRYFAIFFLFVIIMTSFASEPTNVVAYQEGKNIVIEYDLSKQTDVNPYVSVDGGAYVQLKNVSGDVGRNVEVGRRRIVWDVLNQYEKFVFTDVRFKIETSVNLVADICGNTYPVVTIGTQVWMTENLKCNKYDTQSEVYNAKWLTNNTIHTSDDCVYTPYYTDATNKNQWKIIRAGCPNNITDAQVAKLGYLYNWAAAVGVIDGSKQASAFSGNQQGICPNGWHIPSKAEWSTLANYIDGNNGNTDAGKKLKATAGWYNNGNGIDSYGFSALAAGGACANSVFNVGCITDFWTATPSDDSNFEAYILYLDCNSGLLYSNDYIKNVCRSVRCIKN